MPTPQDYVSKKLPAIPYDVNFKPACVLMLAIVDVNGNIIGYLPPKVTDNGDGTASVAVSNS